VYGLPDFCPSRATHFRALDAEIIYQLFRGHRATYFRALDAEIIYQLFRGHNYFSHLRAEYPCGNAVVGYRSS